MSVNTKMTAIADAIREKTGIPSLMTLDDMSKSIEEVYQGGVSYTDEKISEINAELEKTLYGTEYGGKSWYNTPLKAISGNYTRKDYAYAFYYTDFSGFSFEEATTPRISSKGALSPLITSTIIFILRPHCR